jgi:hypothetical protein
VHRIQAKTALLALLSLATLGGCSGALGSSRSKNAETWFSRAKTEFHEGDFEEAHDSVEKALAVAPDDVEIKTLAAEIALTALDYAEVLRLLKGVTSTDASRLRGRALWYKGEPDAAADELESMLNDPAVKDDWAKATSKLARRGQGRAPFTLSGIPLAAVEMVHVSPVAPYFVVRVEIDGAPALALIATGSAEVVVDSSTHPEPGWISLGFGERADGQKLEVHDVPAVAQDLSGFAQKTGAPIKALLGVNLLRRLNATMDFMGHQFVVRNFAPPPPPSATRLDLRYARGGGLLVRAGIGGEKGPKETLMVDTTNPFGVALDDAGWKKAGFDASTLKLLPEDPEGKTRAGVIPLMRLGAFDVPRVDGLYGPSFNTAIDDFERTVGVDIDGFMGARFLYSFRCTLVDGGRLLWIEDNAFLARLLGGGDEPAPKPRGPEPKNQIEVVPPKTPAPPPAPGPRK